MESADFMITMSFSMYIVSNPSSTSVTNYSITLSGPTKELWRSKREVNRGKSRQIAANSIQKTMAITFLKDRDGSRRIAMDRIAEGLPENNGDHFGGEI